MLRAHPPAPTHNPTRLQVAGALTRGPCLAVCTPQDLANAVFAVAHLNRGRPSPEVRLNFRLQARVDVCWLPMNHNQAHHPLAHSHTHIRTHAHKGTRTHTRAHTRTKAHAHISTHPHPHPHTLACAHTHTHTHTCH